MPRSGRIERESPGLPRWQPVIAAAVLVALLLFGSGGDTYTLKARFINAGQLVKGNLVEVGGVESARSRASG